MESNHTIEKAASPSKKAAHSKRVPNHNGNSAHSQRLRLLEALRHRPMNTLEIRRELDILAPSQRIGELKHKHGHDIITHMVKDVTDAGEVHRVARYTLIKQA